MKKRRRWIWRGLTITVLVAAVIAALLEPNRVLRGWITGEHFYRLRPTSYWREILREAGERRDTSKTRGEFYGDDHGLSVLLDCGRDPDPKVRWAAICVLGRKDLRVQSVLSLFTDSLQDHDENVRLAALAALASWRQMARPAVPDMIPLLHDPEEQVCFVTDLALWDIDPAAAREASGWKRFTSNAWGFSADLPGEPEESTLSGAGPIPALSHQFLAVQGGISRYGVAVTDYPEGAVFPPTDEGRLDLARDSILAGIKAQKFTANVSAEIPVEVGGSKGRDIRVEVEGMGFIRSRVFWNGRRLYQVKVVSKPEFLNAVAADYFMDSFRVLMDMDK